MIDSGLCRNEVNRRVRHDLRAFKWAVGEEMVPPSVHHGLQAVPGLRRGRADVRESEPVKPVPDAFVDAVRPLRFPPSLGNDRVSTAIRDAARGGLHHADNRRGHIREGLGLHAESP